MKARLSFLLFMGSVFLAVAAVGLARSEKYQLCAKSCEFRNDGSYLACHNRCKMTAAEAEANDRDEEKEEAAEKDPRLPDPRDPRRPKEKEREEGEEKCDTGGRRPCPGRREKEEEEEKEEEKGEEKEEKEEEEEDEDEEKKGKENPYYLPSDRFETRFENDHGRIRALRRFDKLSPHLRMLRYYRIVQYKSRPGTLIVPHHSDAEYLIINTKGRALVTVVLPNYRESFSLDRFDVLRIPAGAICYTLNRANDQDLELIKLALPVNIPGQVENFYPSGNKTPKSYLKAFHKKTLQAAFNAPYDKIEKVLWGSEDSSEDEGVIVKLERDQLRSFIRRARSRSPKEGKESPLGPFNLKNIEERYSNDHGTFREAHPHRYQPLQDLGIGVSHLKLQEGSMFMPHYNTRAIILAFVADGEGHSEMACPHVANEEEEEEENDRKEGQIKRVEAKLSKNDMYIIPAAHPVTVRAAENNNLEVVEFVLNAPYNFRNFLAGKKDNVLNEMDTEAKEAAFEGSGEEVEKLFCRQRESFFVDREDQPNRGGGVRSPRNKVAWSSFLTAFM